MFYKVHTNFLPYLFLSSHIFVFWSLVFWSLYLCDFLSVFFCLAHLALQNENKDYVIFLYFSNCWQNWPKTKNEKCDEQNIKAKTNIFDQCVSWSLRQSLLPLGDLLQQRMNSKVSFHGEMQLNFKLSTLVQWAAQLG